MAHRTYYGLGPADAAVREFDTLRPYVGQMLDLQRECVSMGPDYMAMAIALDGLQTAAYHFTRRPDFYHALQEAAPPPGGGGERRLADKAQAISAFQGLKPYADRLRQLQGQCRPFGHDYLALDIAKQSLETAAFHFTREHAFYGSKSDSAGPLGPRR